MRIGIHQIYYDSAQIPLLEPAFIPYDNTANPNREWAEYHVFETEFRKGTHKNFDYTGFVSWKFRQKSRISGEAFLDFIKNNPGADVYFINPFPMEELLFKNVWLQGDFYHPGILDFSQKILRRAGYELDLRTWQQPKETFAFCNYWAGNQKFWNAYIAFTEKIADILRNNLAEHERRFLHSLASRQNQFSYVAFIMERMFCSYLAISPGIDACRFAYPDFEIKRRFSTLPFTALRLLRTRSRILAVFRGVAKLALLLYRRLREP